MNFLAATAISLSLLASTSSAAETPTVRVTRIGSQPSVAGPAEYFAGVVRIDSPFKGSELRVQAARP